ncbi:MAG: hypothetical protein AB7K41_15755 [Bdellovibrionales bacterium]
MSLVCCLVTILLLNDNAMAAEPSQDPEPSINVNMKISSYDTKQIVALTDDGQKVILQRRAIKNPLTGEQFRTYQIPLVEWIHKK